MKMSLFDVQDGQTVSLVPPVEIGDHPTGTAQPDREWIVTARDEAGLTLTLAGGTGTDITINIPADFISQVVSGPAIKWPRIMLHGLVKYTDGKTTFEPGFEQGA